jgi:WhiB family redox-sensing transcriptional regulator
MQAVAEHELSEKVRVTGVDALWSDVSRHMHLQDSPATTTFGTTSADDDQFLARILDELVDDVLDGIGTASAGLAHAIARCSDGNGTLTHLFFSDDEFDIARAKAICSRCRLAPSCLEGALERGEPYGVWGGQLLIEGTVVAVKRGRGRPPKHPRPVLVVDEVPVPPHLVA